MFRFKCTSCNEWHEGMPTFGADAPLYFYVVPAEERGNRCVLDADTCIVDQTQFFVRGCLDIPVHGETEAFSWGVWVSLSKDRFADFKACFDAPKRSYIGPFFGWLSAELPLYPSTENPRRACIFETTASGRISNWSLRIILLRSSREMEPRLSGWPKSARFSNTLRRDRCVRAN